MYTTSARVKGYLGISGAGDDALLNTLIGGASAWLDGRTGRTFEASADSTRSISIDYVDGRTLRLPWDLCAITSLTSGGVTVASTQYITKPRYSTPYYALQLRETSTYTWTYATDPEEAVAIVGRWAYSTSAPADIGQAATRLASFLYRQKDAQVFDVTAQLDLGMLTLPQGFPADVRQIVARYGGLL